MIFKEGCFYKVELGNGYMHKDNYLEPIIIKIWYFQFLSYGLTNGFLNVYGYHNNLIKRETVFIDFFAFTMMYICNEISQEEAMELFPDNDNMKISYYRKNKIKKLLNVF